MGERAIASTNGYRLGLDWSNPPEGIDIQALTQAMNCEFDRTDNALRTVSGVTIAYDAGMSIDTLYYDVYRHKWYFTHGIELYETDLKTRKQLGTLTGQHKPKYHAYSGDILVASGGKLQAISGTGELSTVDGSPSCEIVSSHAGRVLVASIYSHRLTWSAIGDYHSWENNKNDSSSGQYLDVGYKDKGAIVAVDFLTRAIIVYKEYGKVYQVVGTPDEGNLSVYPLSSTGFCSGSAINIDDRSYYLGEQGLMSFMPTNTYAEIQPFETGLNINSYLLTYVEKDCEMWHCPSRKQLWIKPHNGGGIFLYHYLPRYQDGRGVFTSRQFVHDVHDVVDVNKNIYVAYGNKIGVLDDRTDLDDGKQIETSIVSGNRLAMRLFVLIMNYNFVTHNLIDGYGSVQISDKTPKPVTFASKSTRTYYADERTFSANDKLNVNEYTKVYKIGGGANRNVQFKIHVQKGAISLRQLDYTYEEV